MKKYLVIFAVLILAIGGIWKISKSRDFQLFGKIVSRVETADKVIALTFDDGPWNEKHTLPVIDTLDSFGVKATFFLNGKGIENNPVSAQRLVSAGHQIGNHSYSHNRLVLKGFDEIKYEIDSTNELIRSLGYNGEIYFRPPYGQKLFVLPYYLEQQGIVSVTWDIEPESYENVKDSIAEHAISNARSGSIVLLHVLGSKNQEARKALPDIIKGLQSKGFQFVTVSELLSRST